MPTSAYPPGGVTPREIRCPRLAKFAGHYPLAEIPCHCAELPEFLHFTPEGAEGEGEGGSDLGRDDTYLCGMCGSTSECAAP